MRALIALASLAFACAAAEPRDQLGAGDTVRITVFQNPDFTTEARLSDQGSIVFPLLGEIALAGATPEKAGTRIAEQLRLGGYVKNPQVSVGVVQVRSRQVSVLGQVGRPGRYPLEDSTRLADILAVAGGIAPTGDDVVTVTGQRDGQPVRVEIDVAAAFRNGGTAAPFEVRSGDTVYVPRAPVFYIYGEVQRAGAYRLEPPMSVMHAISLGGGLAPRGTERGIRIHRRAHDGTLHRLEARATDPVVAGDVIYVRDSFF